MWIAKGIEDPRRRLLLKALAAGIFGVGPARLFAQADVDPLPPGRSIHEIQGTVLVNGTPATESTLIRAGDRLETGEGSRAIFAVGEDAFLLRERSRLETGGEGMMGSSLRLLTGKLLSVFGRTRHQVSTPVATIGIRGTGLYVESEPDRAYVCTCYGVTFLSAAGDPLSTETVESEHHDEPRYILAAGEPGNRIREAPVINHTDEELTLIEALVGREPPFGSDPPPYQRDER
jgi:hypothetical protein